MPFNDEDQVVALLSDKLWKRETTFESLLDGLYMACRIIGEGCAASHLKGY